MFFVNIDIVVYNLKKKKDLALAYADSSQRQYHIFVKQMILTRNSSMLESRGRGRAV